MLKCLCSRLPFLARFKSPVVPVLRLDGVIGHTGGLRQGLTLGHLAEQIEKAVEMPGAVALALVINSPGGLPAQTALIAKRIRDRATEKKLPVLAFVEDVAASGGYWLACAADEVFANDSSIVGSIGVISSGFGFQDLIARWGIERRLHTSGDKKSILDPFRPEQADDVARLKNIQREMHENFKATVRTSRGERLKADEDTLFSGEFWIGRRALELGLIDGLGEVRSTLRARFGEKVKLRRVHGEKRWFSRLPRLGGINAENIGEGAARGFLAAAEERALWSRFGL